MFQTNRLLLLVIAALLIGPSLARAEQPNIVFIFADDHAYQALSAYDDTLMRTPNIDRIGREGMVFDNCFVTNSICGPMRAVIQTGKYSHLNGFIRNGNKFDSSQQIFPRLLRKAGYTTAVIGKWHLGRHEAPQGFDYSEVLLGQGPYYNPPMGLDADGDGKRDKIVKHHGYTTDIITDQTLDWLKNKRDESKPFMLMTQHKAPHREWSPKPEVYNERFADQTYPEPATLFEDYSNKVTPRQTQDMTLEKTMRPGPDLKLGGWSPGNLDAEQRKAFEAMFAEANAKFEKNNPTGRELVRWRLQRYLKTYLASIASIDDNVGRLLKYLDKSGLAENTIVIYCSDQGFYLGEHGWFDKRWVYEESLRTPLLVRWPGVVKPGTRNAEIVSPLDFAQTFLDVAGADQPDGMQGESLVPILKGDTPDDWRKYHYYHYYEYPGAHSVRKHYAVVDGRYKLIHFYEEDVDEWELIDLEADPLETKNFYGKANYAGVQEKLRQELVRLRKQYDLPDAESLGPVSKAEQRRRETRLVMRDVKLKQVLQRDDASKNPPQDIDPSSKAFTVGAWAKPTSENGVVIGQGGQSQGYSLYLENGVPHFAIRSGGMLLTVKADQPVSMNQPVHLVGLLDQKATMRLYVDGKQVAHEQAVPIASNPADALEFGNDGGSNVAAYKTDDRAFKGELSDLRIYEGQLDDKALKAWATR